jgi:L-lactate dehydrogenase complex protein LldE
MRVGLFLTCLVDLMRPSIGFAALKLLESAGCEVIVPEGQTCCGQPNYNAGDYAAARQLAIKLAIEFADCDYVVVPSGSCASMLRVHYPSLFPDDSEPACRVRALAARTYELSDFLVNVLQLKTVPGHYRGRISYHDSCSGLRELGIKQQPRALLAMLPEVELKEMNQCETCCGFGGTFAVKFGDISSQMADNKCRNLHASGANAVVAGDLGCLLNIEGRLRRIGDAATRVLHIAEVLAGEQGEVPCK